MLRFMTAGESHGKSLAGILEGLPGGLDIDRDFINLQLHRRQLGYGRGERMEIEQDSIEILSGVRHGKTLGSPISFLIENKDWNSWMLPMSVDPISPGSDTRQVNQPRPGHSQNCQNRPGKRNGSERKTISCMANFFRGIPSN